MRRTITRLVGSAACAGLLALTLGCAPGGDEASAAMRSPGSSADDPQTTLASAESRLDDAILHFEVKAGLLDALQWDAIGIEVDTIDGRVLLTGEAPDRPTRELAEEVARSVDGVQKVESRLTLAESARKEASEELETGVKETLSEAEREVRDALLEARLEARLLQEIGRHALEIEVEAADGVVTLRGELENSAHEQLALETASTTSGVEEVINLLET